MSYWDAGSGEGPVDAMASRLARLLMPARNPKWPGIGRSGLVPIDDDHPLPPNISARGYDTIQRLAPIVAAFRSRPELIFANGFQ